MQIIKNLQLLYLSKNLFPHLLVDTVDCIKMLREDGMVGLF